MIRDVLMGLLTIILASCLIYLVARHYSPKPPQSREASSTYACGEKITVKRIRVDPTFFQYLIYFLVFDSAVMVLAFASPAIEKIGPLIFAYLGVTFIAVLLLPRPEKR